MTVASGLFDALNAAAHGYPVFPIDANGKPLTEGGHKDASTDPEVISAWWQQHPTAKVGVLPRKSLITAAPFIWRDPATIPKREWLYGNHLIRKFGSATIAPGGVGKSSLIIVEALAMATGRPLLGIKPKQRCRVWYWNGEDPIEEIDRRIAAGCLHFGIGAEDLDGWLFVNSGRDTEIVIAKQTRDGAVIAAPVTQALMDTITKNQIDVLSIDPFISSHRVTENDNNAIDVVAKEWTRIADVTEIAIDLSHHSKKVGGAEVTVEHGRGAVALLAAVRSARVLNQMTEQEAKRAGIDPSARRKYFKGENGKANLAPPPEGADWFQIASVLLGNGRPGELFETGDSVGVVNKWEWPDYLADVTGAHFEKAATAIRAGRWRENSQAKDWVGYAIARALDLDLNDRADKASVAAMIAMWVKAGSLVVVERATEKRELKNFIEVAEDV
jgi:hypothetical protein